MTYYSIVPDKIHGELGCIKFYYFVSLTIWSVVQLKECWLYMFNLDVGSNIHTTAVVLKNLILFTMEVIYGDKTSKELTECREDI